MCQAVFSQSDGLEGEGSETHYYYPATITDATQAAMVTNVQSADSMLTQNAPAGERTGM